MTLRGACYRSANAWWNPGNPWEDAAPEDWWHLSHDDQSYWGGKNRATSTRAGNNPQPGRRDPYGHMITKSAHIGSRPTSANAPFETWVQNVEAWTAQTDLSEEKIGPMCLSDSGARPKTLRGSSPRPCSTMAV